MDEQIKYPQVTVIICTKNEAENLPHVLPKIPEWVQEILLVDGNSNDNTVTVAKEVQPKIKVLEQSGKGKGDAIKLGVKQASSDIIVTLDADGQTDPSEIMKFISPLLTGYDIAKGTRLAHGRPLRMPQYRWFGNKILAITSNILYGTKFTDICSGYNGFKKSSFMRLKLVNDGFAMEQEMMVKAKKAGLKIIEIEHHDAGRLNNSSKVSGIKQGFIDLWVIIKSYF
jgi:glycosyltransferase involved in cell wall biosynthesis